MPISRERLRVLLTIVACGWIAACSARVPRKTSVDALSVCDVVSNPDKYNNKHITIYTDVISSFHGILAFDNSCHGVISIFVQDRSADTEYGKILLRSETESGNGFHHAYIGGVFTAFQSSQGSKTNAHGAIVVDYLKGWLPGRRHQIKGSE